METAVLNLTHLRIDWNVLGIVAMPGSLLVLALTLALLGRALRRTRALIRADLARIFEQLDLLRFDTQQAAVAAPATAPATATATATAVPCEPPVLFRAGPRDADSRGGVGDYYAAAQLAAHGSTAAEIAARCGIVGGEARVLVALQQARARRVAAA